MSDDVGLPRWGIAARSITLTCSALLMVTWVVTGVLKLSTGWSGFSRDDVAVVVAAFVIVGTWWGSGLVWLAGKVVQGYRDPR